MVPLGVHLSWADLPRYGFAAAALLLALFNGTLMALSPVKWVTSKWTLKGFYTPDDIAASASLRLQARLVGGALAIVSGTIAGAQALKVFGFDLNASSLSQILGIVLNLVMMLAGVLALIKPQVFITMGLGPWGEQSTEIRGTVIRLCGVGLLGLSLVRLFSA